MAAKAPSPRSEKESDRSADGVWPLFLTAHAVLVERVEARLAQAGLPPLTWYDVLWALERAAGGRLRLSDLAERIVLSRSNATRLIDRLEEAGLVERERSEEDGRGAYAVLTPAGKALRAKMWPAYKAAISTLFASHVRPAEARTMSAVLRRILDAARR
ncbi:MAG: MarR family transcriptional regulator [Burkholderiales bacterium]|nr:MarR family transcriptional regulator [Burkholderiales bacterium]